jgi:DNA-directed RNA polymerase specialized sigma24 family protein
VTLATRVHLKEKAMPLMSQSNDDDQSPPPDGPRANREERDAMLRDAELRASTSRVIQRGGVPDADNEDVVQVTLLAAHGAQNLPKDPVERVRYVHGVGRNKAGTHLRKARRSPRLEPGADVERVAQAADADPVADRNLLSRLESTLNAEQIGTWRALARTILGEDLAEIARDVGVQYDTLYKRVTTLKRQLRENAVRMGAGVGVLLLVLGFSWSLRRPPAMGTDEPGPAHIAESATSTHAAEPDPMDVARAVRGRAFRSCMNNQWQACIDDLDLAAEIDPTGDTEPTVQAARTDAEGGIQHDQRAMPGERWAPPKVRLYAGLAAR